MSGSKRSPETTRKRTNARPFSLYVSPHSYKSNSTDSLSSFGVRYEEQLAPKSPSSSLSRTKKGKRYSSAETLACDSTDNFDPTGNIFGGGNSWDSSTFSKSSTYEKNKKKSGAQSNRNNMPPPGPSAKTWMIPKSVKRLATTGNVFGTHIGKSGICYVSVVSPKGDRLIQAYDRNGILVKSFPARATKAGKSFEPYQIHETPEGHLAVASGNSVTVWSKEGKLVTEHGKNMFKYAKCLAVRSTGEIVVTDTDNDAVKIISASGQQIYQLEENFKCPVGVAVDSNDCIIVSDWTDKIRVFDADNELIHTFGMKGNNDGEMDLPYGVAVDCENNIIIADMWNHRLSVYTQDGKFLKHLEPGQSVRMPAHVSVATGMTADDYRLAVTDFSASSVKLIAY